MQWEYTRRENTLTHELRLGMCVHVDVDVHGSLGGWVYVFIPDMNSRVEVYTGWGCGWMVYTPHLSSILFCYVLVSTRHFSFIHLMTYTQTTMNKQQLNKCLSTTLHKSSNKTRIELNTSNLCSKFIFPFSTHSLYLLLLLSVSLSLRRPRFFLPIFILKLVQWTTTNREKRQNMLFTLLSEVICQVHRLCSLQSPKWVELWLLRLI